MGSKVVTLEVKTFMDTFLGCGPPDKVSRTTGTFFKNFKFFSAAQKPKKFFEFENCSLAGEAPDKVFGVRISREEYIIFENFWSEMPDKVLRAYGADLALGRNFGHF